jgi:hypothetical protein
MMKAVEDKTGPIQMGRVSTVSGKAPYIIVKMTSSSLKQ